MRAQTDYARLQGLVVTVAPGVSITDTGGEEMTSAGLMMVVVPDVVFTEGTPEITRDAGGTQISSTTRLTPTVSRAKTTARSLTTLSETAPRKDGDYFHSIISLRSTRPHLRGSLARPNSARRGRN
jgi:hypothetical protein